MNLRIGIGFDLHRLGPGSSLILGGVEIPHNKGLIAHSDGDVLCHAIIDALLGAAGRGNIGEMFPDTNPMYAGVSSLKLLAEAMSVVRQSGLEIGNIDSNILAEQPRLLPFFGAMKEKIAGVLEIPLENIHIKAKTMERLGIIGTEQAIAAEAVVLLVTHG